MRLFGSERIAKIMDSKFMGFQEGDMIEHPMISKSIENAQKKVEENNFGIRKRLLEYDDVMNKQRTVIYTKRRHALMGERIGMDIVNMIWDRCYTILDTYTFEDAKLEFLKTKLHRLVGNLLAGLDPAIAPVCGKRKSHDGNTIRSNKNERTASSFIERSLWR